MGVLGRVVGKAVQGVGALGGSALASFTYAPGTSRPGHLPIAFIFIPKHMPRLLVVPIMKFFGPQNVIFADLGVPSHGPHGLL